MDKKKIKQVRQQYDLIIHNIENAGIEFWYARELMPLLGYGRIRSKGDQVLFGGYTTQEKKIAAQAGKLPDAYDNSEEKNDG